MPYQCPLCHHPLQLSGNQWRCHNNHQFDQAKEGYVNLMPAHHKGSKNPGDNKAMMQARRQFLEAGHYAPLREAVIAKLARHLPSHSTALLDIGCGEGYYTAGFTGEAVGHPDLVVHGLDIAKVAVRYAAKRHQACHFCVASSHRLPFADASLNGIVRIYAPCKAEELKRTVKPGGIVLTVTPAPRHLYQLKALIYDDVRLHAIAPEQIDGFTLIDEQQLHQTLRLPGADATALMQMTPFAWKTSDATWQQLAASEVFPCETDFMLRVYRRV